MFKPGRWWSEKNKIKVHFKLQFRLSQLPHVGDDGLIISVIPAESGKPTAKSEKSTVQNGSCLWENPVYETVKFNRDPKTRKIHERLYYFSVGMGLSKSGALGEASIDFSNYAEATKVSTVSLPLKNSIYEAILHVSIQRIHESMDERETEERVDQNTDETIRTNSSEDISFNKTYSPPDLKTKDEALSVSDVMLSSSESSPGIETHWGLPLNSNGRTHQDMKSGLPTVMYKDHCTSWDWLGSPKDDNFNNLKKETFLEQENSKESPDILIQKLKADILALSRQAAMSELELQTLRGQVAKERKRGHDLSREINFLKEEKDSLNGECENLKASLLRRMNEARLDSQEAVVEELQQELDFSNELNANLQIQLQKMQEANAELVLAVQDLDQMLERKNREANPMLGSDGADADNDDEQKALEDLVKEHRKDSKEPYLVDRNISDLLGEIAIYKHDRDELEVQMEQLALDYEIMKQANHELSRRLEQTQIQEQLKMQYGPLSPEADMVGELESHIETLENELKRFSKDYTESFAEISSLKAHSRSLEEELGRQERGFKADLEALKLARVEQEQRAVQAEEALKRMRWKYANTAERLQEEFRRLSLQMASTFEANEKAATKAMAEASELLIEKSHLEKMLQKAREEHNWAATLYQSRLNSMGNEIEGMRLEIGEKAGELEKQRKCSENTRIVLSDEILVLREEIEALVAKNKILLEEIESKKILMHEVERMRVSVKENELLVEQGNDERAELRIWVEELNKELDEMRCLLKEKESAAAKMKTELDMVQAQCGELKESLLEQEVEKEKLRKQVVQLKSDLKKREEAVINTEKKTKDGSIRGTNLDLLKSSKTSKPRAWVSKEVTNLKERIKLLESRIKSKETDLETSTTKFRDKERGLHNTIHELEKRLRVFKSTGQEVEKEYGDHTSISNGKINELLEAQMDSPKTAAHIEELNGQMTLLKEKNKSMEEELKEMQKRYLDISLKFAEVEGERQQLVMKLRSL